MPYINIEDCSHSGAHEEVMGGQRTGEYMCDRCGESWTSWESVERAQAAFQARCISTPAGKAKHASAP